jgi:hypothetical protein
MRAALILTSDRTEGGELFGARTAHGSLTEARRLQEFQETGATGLEPATSGVTGRYRLVRYNRLPPEITG